MPFYEQNHSLRANATSKNSKVALITGVTGQVGYLNISVKRKIMMRTGLCCFVQYFLIKSVIIRKIISMMRANFFFSFRKFQTLSFTFRELIGLLYTVRREVSKERHIEVSKQRLNFTIKVNPSEMQRETIK